MTTGPPSHHFTALDQARKRESASENHEIRFAGVVFRSLRHVSGAAEGPFHEKGTAGSRERSHSP